MSIFLEGPQPCRPNECSLTPGFSRVPAEAHYRSCFSSFPSDEKPLKRLAVEKGVSITALKGGVNEIPA